MIGLGHALTLALSPMAGGAGPSFDGPLDVLIGQGATVLRAFSVRRLMGAYAGVCGTLRGNGTGAPEADIPFVDGALDKTAVAALISNGSGSEAFWKALNDQSGYEVDATNTTVANQPAYSVSGFTTGAIGGGGAQSNCWLNMNLGVLTLPFSVFAVVMQKSAGRVIIIGNSVSDSIGYVASGARHTANYNPSHNWGLTAYAATANFSLENRDVLMCVNNGTSSKMLLNGTVISTANPGSTMLDMTTGRIGMGMSASENWLNAAGNAIAEVIVFSCDPTGLAGWTDFLAGTKSYFGTV